MSIHTFTFFSVCAQPVLHLSVFHGIFTGIIIIFFPSECTIVYLTEGLVNLHLGSEDVYSWSLFDCSCSMW